jgi:2-dehydropantoate 2-reductase
MFMKNIAVIGTGAIGGYYGGLLARAGHAVHFLLRSDYEYVRDNGLRVDSVNGNFHLKTVNAYASASDMPRCDVVLVALKATANDMLPDVLPGVVHDNSIVALFQNGIGGEEFIHSIVPGHTIVGGLCFICSNKIGPGHICHLDYGKVTLGQFSPDSNPGGITPELMLLEQVFINAGIETDMVEDLVLARWKKLVWNVPFNGLSVLCNALTDTLVKDSDTREQAYELMREVVQGAAAFGRNIPEAFVEKMLQMTEIMEPYKPSMLLDYENGRPLEIEAIYGEPLRRAKERGCSLPRIEEMYQRLKTIRTGGCSSTAGKSS